VTLLASACTGSSSSGANDAAHVVGTDASPLASDASAPTVDANASPPASDAPAPPGDAAQGFDAGPDTEPYLDAATDSGESGVARCGPGQLAVVGVGVNTLAVDDASVYWSETFDGGGKIRKCAVAGCQCQPTTVVETTSRSSPIALASGMLYFGSSDHAGSPVIAECPVSGCTQPTPVTGSLNSNPPLEILADSDNVYWTNVASTTIFRCPATGCAQGTVFAQGSAGTFALDATNVYWTGAGPAQGSGYAPGIVFSCPKSGCTQPTILAQGPMSNPLNVPTYGWSGPLAVDSTSVYWEEQGTYGSGDGTGNGSLMTCAIAGCATPTVLAQGLPLPDLIAADGSHVYWSGSYVGVQKCDVVSCSQASTIAPTDPSGITNFVVDATSVYWTTGWGALMKAPK
jgi:hypothetical protein